MMTHWLAHNSIVRDYNLLIKAHIPKYNGIIKVA